jgi:hypothetical protein
MAADEDFVDEVLYCDESPSSLSKTDRALHIMDEVLRSDEFSAWQDDFADRYCDFFDPKADLPPQCMTIYKEYVALVEGRVLQRVQETIPDFDFEDLIPVIRQHRGDDGFMFANVFEMLNAAIDFTEFRALMASYKQGKGVSLDFQTLRLG